LCPWPAVVDDVQRLHQPGPVALIVFQAQLKRPLGSLLQVGQYHADLGHVKPELEDGVQVLDGRTDDGTRICAGPAQWHNPRAGIPGVALPERTGTRRRLGAFAG